MVNSHELQLVTFQVHEPAWANDRVSVLATPGRQEPGSRLVVNTSSLKTRIARLPDGVEIVVFIDQMIPDDAMAAMCGEMIAEFSRSPADALTRYGQVTEAIKHVEQDRIVAGLDRRSLVAIRPPEVIGRALLEGAIDQIVNAGWVNPTELVSAGGASVKLFGNAVAPSRPRRPR